MVALDKVLIIDAMNFICRSNITATAQLSDYIIVFNFFRNLRSLIEKFTPDKIFFCKEGQNNYRYKVSLDYKANRHHKLIKNASINSSLDDRFYNQVNIIYNLLYCLPITQVSADGYEADDVALTITDACRYEHNTLISSDKDWIQILQQGYINTQLYNPIKKEYKIAPNYNFFIFQCLFGDKSDNIPQLLPKMKAIDLASNPQKLSDFLSTEENRANFQINRQLVELKRVPDSELMVEDYRVDFEYLKVEFKEMEFDSLLRYEYWQKFKKTFSSVRL